MAKKIVFVFAGTSETAAGVHKFLEDGQYKDDVVRVYFNGCQDSAIGGRSLKLGYLSPNMDTVASKIKSSFDKDKNLSIEELKKQFGDSILIEPADTKKVEVEHITLNGFSRGAVTAFAVARHLNDLGKPMSLYGEDPVPGDSMDSSKGASTEFYKNHDLRKCNNLVHAEVTIGAYKKKAFGIHNKYYRQMVPLFPDTCETAVYKVPKFHHFHFSAKGKNQQTDFFVARGLKNNESRYYVETKDRLTFVPKAFEQKPHIGVIGRTEMLPRYKKALFNQVMEHTEITEDTSIKTAMALHALNFAADSTDKTALKKTVLEDSTSKGKAFREFVVEFENINQYVFRKTGNDKTKTAINQFREEVYKKLNAFPVDKATPDQRKEFTDHVLASLKKIKKDIPDQYKELKGFLTDFLQENVVFHTDLTQYLDESETFKKRPSTLKSADAAMVTLETAKSSAEMAEILYNMSKNRRSDAINHFPKDPQKLIKDASSLGDVLRFLPVKGIDKLFKIKEIKELIKNFEDLNGILNKTFNADQRLAVYNAVKDNLKEMQPTFAQLGTLMQHVPLNQCQSLAKLIKAGKVKTTSSAELIDFFEKLNTTKFNQVILAFDKSTLAKSSKMKAYTNVTITSFLTSKQGCEKLETYLRKRATGDEQLKVVNQLFPKDDLLLITAQKDLKSRLASVVETEGKPKPVIGKLL